MYAHDTIFFNHSSSDPMTLKIELKRKLDMIDLKLIRLNQLTLNIKKTKRMFGTWQALSKFKNISLTYEIVDKFKHVGVVFDAHL